MVAHENDEQRRRIGENRQAKPCLPSVFGSEKSGASTPNGNIVLAVLTTECSFAENPLDYTAAVNGLILAAFAANSRGTTAIAAETRGVWPNCHNLDGDDVVQVDTVGKGQMQKA